MGREGYESNLLGARVPRTALSLSKRTVWANRATKMARGARPRH
jgi:hypothetical protein